METQDLYSPGDVIVMHYSGCFTRATVERVIDRERVVTNMGTVHLAWPTNFVVWRPLEAGDALTSNTLTKIETISRVCAVSNPTEEIS